MILVEFRIRYVHLMSLSKCEFHINRYRESHTLFKSVKEFCRIFYTLYSVRRKNSGQKICTKIR
jgi:hypothetical protein